MFLVFYRTNDVFEAEELLSNAGVDTEIVPTPVQDIAYCGVCVKIKKEDADSAAKALKMKEYKRVE